MKRTDGISTIASARLPNEKYARLEAMAKKIGEDNISRLIQLALLEFIERHDGMDANEFAKLRLKYPAK